MGVINTPANSELFAAQPVDNGDRRSESSDFLGYAAVKLLAFAGQTPNPRHPLANKNNNLLIYILYDS
ncbi:MAG: hypothetical protein JSR79_04435 [Proteobacteria bacterium]|nr:hypothetical protein [Pseudomonadota bacterium]